MRHSEGQRAVPDTSGDRADDLPGDLRRNRVDRLVVVYVAVAAGWIAVSSAVAAVFSDSVGVPLVLLELLKGLAFVAATALILRVLLRRWAGRVERAALLEREAGARIRDAHALRTGFLTGVSHEIRTPLTAVTGFARTLQAHGEELDATQQRELADRLVANAERLDALVLDLLDITAATEGIPRLRLREADVGEILVRAAALHVDPERHLRVLDGTVRAEVDVPKVERVVFHLLDNVRRHTPPGTTATLSARAEDEDVVLRLEDDGPGLPSDDLRNLLAPFTQGPAATTAPSPGVGIGLAIVDRYTRMHGGHVRSRPGDRGACIEVVLPLRGAGAPDGALSGAEPTGPV